MKRFSSAIPVRVAAALSMTLIAGGRRRHPMPRARPASPATAARRAPARPSAADPTVSRPVLPSSGIPNPPLSLRRSRCPKWVMSSQSTSSRATATNATCPATTRPVCPPAPQGRLTGNGRWCRTRRRRDTTRVVVYRPINPRKFNGTVVVEWLNVSGGLETPSDPGAQPQRARP